MIPLLVATAFAAPDDCADPATCERMCRSVPFACVRLGWMYETGDRVDADPERAFALYERACRRGSTEGCVRVGRARANGMGVPADLVRAQLWFSRMCIREPAGCYEWAELLMDWDTPWRDVPRAVWLHDQACERGHEQSCLAAAAIRADGLAGPRDPTVMTLAWARSCEAGEALACESLGSRLERGEGAVRSDEAAADAFEKGCEGKAAGACDHLGQMVATGRGREADPDAALLLWRRGCEQGSADSCHRVATLTGERAFDVRGCEGEDWGACTTLATGHLDSGSIARWREAIAIYDAQCSPSATWQPCRIARAAGTTDLDVTRAACRLGSGPACASLVPGSPVAAQLRLACGDDCDPAPTAVTASTPTPIDPTLRACVASHVEYLASPLLAGRGNGQPGLELAADRIATALTGAGFATSTQPFEIVVDRRGSGELRSDLGEVAADAWRPLGYSASGSFDAPIVVATPAEVIAGKDVEDVTATVANVLGVLPGRGALAGEAIVVGAHYDHLGVDVDGVVYAGADDNASGVAAMLCALPGIRDALDPTSSRTLVAVAFAGEELGLRGSHWFVAHPPAGPVAAMVNLDMVGRLDESPLTVTGTRSAAWEPIVRDAATAAGVASETGVHGYSDDVASLDAGIPAIHLSTTVDHDDYHEPTDVPVTVDADGVARVAAMTAGIVVAISVAPIEPADTCDGPAEAPLGVRFAWSPEPGGVRVTCVRPGGAGAAFGLVAGDLVTAVAGVPVGTRGDLDRALGERWPVDPVVLAVTRGGIGLELRVR